MIQRLQSIFLLLVAISMGLLLAFDIWEKVSTAEGEVVTLDAYYLTHYQLEGVEEGPPPVIQQEPAWYIAILASLSAVVAIYSIFRYDNRMLQIKLGALNSLLIGATFVSIVALIQLQGEEMLISEEEGTNLTGFYLPIFALVFNMLANRFVRKDEALVRSADRFR